MTHKERERLYPAAYAAQLKLAHGAFDWLLAQYLLANEDARPSTTTTLQLMEWSSKKQRELVELLATARTK